MSADSMPALPRVPKDVMIRHCPGWPRYAITSDGDLWSCCPRNRNDTSPSWRRLCPTLDNYGYLKTVLSKGGRKFNRMIHRLVLEAFVGPRPSGQQARHYPDRTRTNNRLSNLSWGTPLANQADRVAHKTDLKGSSHPNAVLSEDDVRSILKGYVKGCRDHGCYGLAKMHGVTSSTIHAIVKRKQWRSVSTPSLPGVPLVNPSQ